MGTLRRVAPDPLLAGLDDSQRAAVTDTHRPLAILAPAGSGKTRVLVRRVAWLSEQGEIDPRRTLCLSFTREAARELRSRLTTVGLHDLPAAATFHATAAALLRVWHADRGRRPPKLAEDRRALLARALGDVAMPDVSSLELEIGWAKGRGIGPKDYAARARAARRSPPDGVDVTATRYAAYETSLARGGLIDFDDLLSNCADAIDRDAAFAASQRWRFRHLFVDEFQDLNPLQFRLLGSLLGGRGDVTVVGDPDQAIYGWNGADARYLTDVEEHLPGAKVIRLETNYRSVGPVVAVSSALLSTPVEAARTDGPVPEVRRYANEADECAGIAEWARARHHEGVGWSDQAVLVRTNALARKLVSGLRAVGIPAAPDGAGRGPSTTDLVAVAARGSSMADLLSPDEPIEGDEGAGEVAAACAELAREYLALDPGATPARFTVWLRAAGAGGHDGQSWGPRITVATFHAAKGLEWRAVQVVGLEEGYVPAGRARTTARHAEERRLLYVALSRATDRLCCSWTAQRHLGGRRVERRPSPFLDVVVEACETATAAEAQVAPGEAARRARQTLAHAAKERDFAQREAEARVAALGLGRRAADTALLEALVTWRAGQARAAGITAPAVLTDATLEAVARTRPRTVDELAATSGVGPLRARRLAPGLLAALAAAT